MFEIFVYFFFLSRSNRIFELSQSTILAKISAPQAKLKKKQPKKGVFWKIRTKKSRFFGARSPLKVSIYWRQRRLQKVFRVRHQKWILENSTKGRPFESAEVRIPEEKANPPAKSPKSAPNYSNTFLVNLVILYAVIMV